MPNLCLGCQISHYVVKVRKSCLYLHIGDEWEYTLWEKLRSAYGNNFRLEHVDVSNTSKVLQSSNIPEVILCISCNNSFYTQYFDQKIS